MQDAQVTSMAMWLGHKLFLEKLHTKDKQCDKKIFFLIIQPLLFKNECWVRTDKLNWFWLLERHSFCGPCYNPGTRSCLCQNFTLRGTLISNCPELLTTFLQLLFAITTVWRCKLEFHNILLSIIFFFKFLTNFKDPIYMILCSIDHLIRI